MGKQQEEQKGFAWYSLRIIFYLMFSYSIFLLAGSFFISFISEVVMVLSIFLIPLSIFVIVVSIINLVKYDRKVFATISLIISSLSFIFYVILLFRSIFEIASPVPIG